MFASICVLAGPRHLCTNQPRSSYRLRCTLLTFPLVYSSQWLARHLTTSSPQLVDTEEALGRKKKKKEKERWGEDKEVRKWGDGRRECEIPWWVLLSSLRITTTSTVSGAAEGSVPQVHTSSSPNGYPTVERQMWWVWFSHRGETTKKKLPKWFGKTATPF